nr:hypothetical protein Iba_chr03bCG5340 [Ipomoea batatas]
MCPWRRVQTGRDPHENDTTLEYRCQLRDSGEHEDDIQVPPVGESSNNSGSTGSVVSTDNGLGLNKSRSMPIKVWKLTRMSKPRIWKSDLRSYERILRSEKREKVSCANRRRYKAKDRDHNDLKSQWIDADT